MMTKVLVIDDEKSTLMMFELFLNAYGYQVLTAESGSEGLAIFEKEHPAVVFTDVKMPGMDGLSVLKRIKKSPFPAEVIVITGHGDQAFAKEALANEATFFINKPIRKEALDAALKEAAMRIAAREK